MLFIYHNGKSVIKTLGLSVWHGVTVRPSNEMRTFSNYGPKERKNISTKGDTRDVKIDKCLSHKSLKVSVLVVR